MRILVTEGARPSKLPAIWVFPLFSFAYVREDEKMGGIYLLPSHVPSTCLSVSYPALELRRELLIYIYMAKAYIQGKKARLS